MAAKRRRAAKGSAKKRKTSNPKVLAALVKARAARAAKLQAKTKQAASKSPGSRNSEAFQKPAKNITAAKKITRRRRRRNSGDAGSRDTRAPSAAVNFQSKSAVRRGNAAGTILGLLAEHQSPGASPPMVKAEETAEALAVFFCSGRSSVDAALICASLLRGLAKASPKS